MPDEYDVERETEFNRDKLQAAIPTRLEELGDILATHQGRVDGWYADLIYKVLLNVKRVCSDLLATMNREALSAAAWNARNLLELWIWTRYCGSSRENARRFYEDALRDINGLVDSLSKLYALREIPNDFEDFARHGIAELAQKFQVDPESGYQRVANAATSIGLGDWFSPNNAFLSKFAHPTAGLVLGIMHQTNTHRALQAVLTTDGVYFAGQCVIALEEIVLAISPA
jgi:hypothetical protein